MRTILIVAAMAVVAWPSLAQSAKEQYGLAERCGRRAAEVFAVEWGNDLVNRSETVRLRADYENHYNLRLNKCFYLEKATGYIDTGPFKMYQLYDLYEDREVASFVEGTPRYCDVQGKSCENEQEVRELIKPFMED